MTLTISSHLSIGVGLLCCLPLISNTLAAQNDTIRGTIEHDGEYLIRDIFLAGECFEVFNIELRGEVGQAGTFANGLGSIGIESGIVLSNGNVTDISGPNTEGNTSTDYGRAGNDPDLELLSQLEGDVSNLGQADLVVLEFDFTPTVANASFDFVFASEEYCEFALSTFYDTFGFFVSGPGINGPYTNNAENVAVVPGSSSPITARNVNFFNNASYYRNNIPALHDDVGCTLGAPAFSPDLISFDGFTVPLTAQFVVEPCQTYHLKLVVADRSSDASWDSAVFLAGNSFAAGLTSNITSTVRGPSTSDNAGLEGCGEAVLIFSRGDSLIANDLVVNYDILPSSTATEGIDFSEIPDSIIIPAGVYEDTIIVQLFADNITEGEEFFTIKLDNPCQCSRGELSFSIVEPPPLRADITGRQEICLGEAVELAATPTSGNGLITYEWENGDIDSLYNVAPLTTRTHRITLTDECGQVEIVDTEVTVNAPSATISGDITICEGVPTDSITIFLSGADTYNFELTDVTGSTPYTNIMADSIKVPVNGTNVYELMNLEGEGCPGVTAGVASSVEVDVFFDFAVDTVSCFGGNDGLITLTALGGDGAYTYEWDHDPSLSTNIANGLSSGTYAALAYDSRGCQDTISVTVPEPTALILDFDESAAFADCQTDGSLLAMASGGTMPFTYEWSNGDTTAQVTNLAPDNYQVTLTDANGCEDIAMAEVTDRTAPPPAPIITPPAMLDCDQTSVQLDARASDQSPELRYHWQNANGDSLALADPLLWTTGQAGTYTLIVTNTLTACQETASVEVQSNTSSLQVSIDAVQNALDCNTNSIALSAVEANGNPVEWTWSTSDGLIDGNLTGTNVIAQGGGWYYLRGDAPGSNCFGLDSILINVDTLAPTIQLNGTERLSCSSPTSELEVSLPGGGNYTYQWDTDGVLTGDPTTASITATTAGSYQVTVTNTDNQCNSTAELLVTDNRTTVSLLAIEDQVLNCITNAVALTAQASGGSNFEYYWIDAAGDTLARSPMYTVVDPGNLSVLVINTDNDCSGTTSFSVQLDTIAPLADIPLPDTITCSISSIELTNVTTNADWEARWEDATGTPISSGNWTQSVNMPGTYNLIVTNTINGCQDTAQTMVSEINTPPLATLNLPDTLNCSIDEVALEVTPSQSGNYAYAWAGPVNGLSGPTDATRTIATRPGTYTLQLTDTETGCDANYEVTVAEDIADLEINPIPDTSLTCVRTQLDLVGSSPTVANLSYRWLDAMGNEISNTANLTVITAGAYELEVTNNDNGCDRSISVTVDDDTAEPQLSPQPISPINCAQAVSSLSVEPGPTTWQTYWLSSNNDTLARDQWSYTANASDNYQLLVTDTENGCFSLTSFPLTVDTISPVFQITNGITLNCVLDEAVLEATPISGSGDYDFSWSGPDGGILSMPTTPNVTIGSGGLYQVQATDNSNGCIGTFSSLVNQDTLAPQLTVPQDTSLDCSRVEVDIQASSITNANLNYSWTDNQGNELSSTDLLNATLPGVYTMLLTNADNFCTSTATVVVTDESELPSVEAGPAATIGCDNAEVTLQAEVGPANYQPQWFNSVGQPILSGNWTLNTSIPGLYTLEVTNPDNNCSNSDTVRVSLDQNVPNAIVADALLDCLTGTAVLDLNGSTVGPSISYTLLTNTGQEVLSSSEPALSLSTPGDYQLLLTDINNGCSATANFTVSSDLPQLDEVVASSPQCLNGQGLIEINTVNGGTPPYLYALNDGAFGLSPSFRNLTAGTYEVVVQDANGCEDQQEVSLSEPNSIEISLEEQYEIKLGESLILRPQINRDTSGLMLSWQPAQWLSCADCLRPSVLSSSTQVFELTVTDENGCQGVARTVVIVDERIPVYVPNAFSPDGDGTNDRFVIFGDPAQIGTIEEMSIFDRWGTLVFQEKAMQANDDSLAWDGSFNGQALNSGVYVYMFRIQLRNGETATYQGEVLLIR